MPKRKPLTDDQKAKMNAQKKQKRASETPEESAKRRAIEAMRRKISRRKETPQQTAKRRAIEAERVTISRRKETPKQTAKRRAMEAERVANSRQRETPNEASRRKTTDAQRKASVRAEQRRMEDLNSAINGKKMMLILNRVETNVTRTLLEHGLTLSHDDLQTLNNFRKAAASSEKAVAQATDSIETKSPSICPTVLLTIHESEMPQLMEEPLRRVEQQKVVTTSLSSPPPVVVQSTLVPATATPKVIHSSKNSRECKNKLVEHLELTKQVSTPSTYDLPTVEKYNQNSPAVKNSNVQTNTFKPLTKTPLHSVSNGVNIPSVTNPQTVVLKTLPNSQAKSRSVRVVSRVQIIRLSDENLQKLQNNKSHIQYLSSKEDLSPQETLLMPKLLQNQQVILSAGITVPTIPGQSVQGIPFLSGECMYVVQVNTSPALPAIQQRPTELVTIRQSPKEVITKVSNAEPAEPADTPFKIDNSSESSPNLPQANNPATKKVLELVSDNGRDYILPDSERITCNSHTCVIEAALLRTQLNQKTIALESCNLELDNMKKELEKAKEYIGNLRAQLEENTQTLCSYLANCS